ncbi:DNA polymerase III subunit delta [Pantoea sp. Nvir]|uniref:DNA polymerase III subunit delta n=1 Tax=Pantoea sp. Nvir TaxID=2576760 RepID=UPI00135A94AC|nr:DNA polymerase III subunit delta [Pantoea sp. Nvir]MXP66345.1 DNA polymerase III subunit delta [Pantoea sp. Nvir]CAJ0993024.1 DNA polymerase III subunit delta [Pantoea sp. Nvir]
MIKIYPDKLSTQLCKGLHACYLLIGNEPLLLQESADKIRAAATSWGFEEHLNFTLDINTNWEDLFGSCQLLSLFARRQIITLYFPETGPNSAMAHQLSKLASLLHSDILLVCHMIKLTKAQQNSAWFKAFAAYAILVPCQTLEHRQLPSWIATRAKSMKLLVEDEVIQVLCYYYEGNMLALAQALERLSLICPDGKLTLPRVEEAVSDEARFTAFHWVDAMLGGKGKRALHILHKLKNEDSEPVILMRTLQRDVMTLLHLQRYQTHQPLRLLMDQRCILQTRRTLFIKTLQRVDSTRLQQAIHLLAQIELILKKDYGQDIWPQLETLSLIFCHQHFPTNCAYV